MLNVSSSVRTTMAGRACRRENRELLLACRSATHRGNGSKMAQISLEELVALIKRAPEYHRRWELDVPAEQALYIRFGSAERVKVRSEVLEAANGSEIVLDREEDGRVVGFEIT